MVDNSHIWLVDEPPICKKYEFINQPFFSYWGKWNMTKHVNETTNQIWFVDSSSSHKRYEDLITPMAEDSSTHWAPLEVLVIQVRAKETHAISGWRKLRICSTWETNDLGLSPNMPYEENWRNIHHEAEQKHSTDTFNTTRHTSKFQMRSASLLIATAFLFRASSSAEIDGHPCANNDV